MQVDGKDPFLQADLRALHDGPEPHAEMLPARLAAIGAVFAGRVLEGLRGTAMGAVATVRPNLLFEPIPRRIFRREPPHEVQDRHTFSV